MLGEDCCYVFLRRNSSIASSQKPTVNSCKFVGCRMIHAARQAGLDFLGIRSEFFLSLRRPRTYPLHCLCEMLRYHANSISHWHIVSQNQVRIERR